VHKQGHYFDQGAFVAMLRRLQQKRSVNSLYDELALSKREVEILKELCYGKTNRTIAETCNISMATVNFHRANIYRKTQSRSISDLMKYGIRHGMIDLSRQGTGR
jgi:DNA-binding NarL/FixJ family response regulator